jgi:DNA-binding NarL/FixJ family response regulator
MDVIRLFIVEDQPAILKAQIKLLNSFDNIEIIGSAMSGEDAVLQLATLTRLSLMFFKAVP